MTILLCKKLFSCINYLQLLILLLIYVAEDGLGHLQLSICPWQFLVKICNVQCGHYFIIF